MTRRPLVAGCLASLASTLVFAAPMAGQSGRDLLLPERPTAFREERVALAEGVNAVRVAADSRDLPSSGRGHVGSAQPATAVYSYDDDSFEGFLALIDAGTDDLLFEMEFAQRFRLQAEGSVEYAEVCMARGEDDGEPVFDFSLNFYSDAAGLPGEVLQRFPLRARYQSPNTLACIEASDALGGLPVGGGQVRVAVSWRRESPPENTKRLALDEDSSGGRRAFRARPEEGDAWEGWRLDTNPGVYGIRLAVNHPDPEPDPDPGPDPDPDPDPDDGPPTGEGYTDCTPETTPLVFDGGYNVRMCYETAQGTLGEGKAGIWASGESGLLWFFTRDNAEVLIKVLDGCAINNHRWVYVAPVTDLAFNLYVTDGEGRTWSHHNRQGRTASTRSDNEAFPCSN